MPDKQEVELTSAAQADLFDLTGVERGDTFVVSYRCPSGHSFDKFVARKNLARVGTTPCINHPDQTATIHSSRLMH